MHMDRELRDRLLFTLMAGTLAGVSAVLTTRLSEYAWVRLTHRAPPERIAALSAFGLKLGKELVDGMGRFVPILRHRS